MNTFKHLHESYGKVLSYPIIESRPWFEDMGSITETIHQKIQSVNYINVYENGKLIGFFYVSDKPNKNKRLYQHNVDISEILNHPYFTRPLYQIKNSIEKYYTKLWVRTLYRNGTFTNMSMGYAIDRSIKLIKEYQLKMRMGWTVYFPGCGFEEHIRHETRLSEVLYIENFIEKPFKDI